MKNEEWCEQAYGFLCKYMKHNRIFMTEEVRVASENVLFAPTSDRAWGHIMVRAVRENKIVRSGYRKVSNKKAHSATATLWRVL